MPPEPRDRRRHLRVGHVLLMSTSKYRYISIEGNIGAGKTTLVERLARDLEYRMVLETFSDNPFLPLFYSDPDRHAFTVELFFLMERHRQLRRELAQGNLFEGGVISDYFFRKTLLFARNNLSALEFRLFQQIFERLHEAFPQPDLLVYLHRPVDQLLEQIRGRGRTFEQDIPPEYLLRLQRTYLDYFQLEESVPILLLDLGDSDFLAEWSLYTGIQRILTQPHEPGMRWITLQDLRKTGQ